MPKAQKPSKAKLLAKILLLLLSLLLLAIFLLALLGLFHLSLWLTIPIILAYVFVLKKLPHHFKPLLILPLLLFLGLLLWRVSLQPSTTRNWPTELKNLATSTTAGSTLTIKNYRNFDWTQEPPLERWQNKAFSLEKLSSVDLLIVPLTGSNTFAHVMLTFHFGDTEQLSISIEARREVNEPYHVIPGALNQFELIHILGSEEDLFTLRTHHRDSHIYRFPLKLDLERQHSLLKRLLDRTNELAVTPAFYRSFSHNCTTALIKEADVILEQMDGNPLELHIESIFTAHIAYGLHRQNLLQHPSSKPLILKKFLTATPHKESKHSEN